MSCFEVFFNHGQFRASGTQNPCIPILNSLRHQKCFPNKIMGKTIGLGWREQGVMKTYLQGRHVILQDGYILTGPILARRINLTTVESLDW